MVVRATLGFTDRIIVSMYRKINYTKVEKGEGHMDTADPKVVRNNSKGIPGVLTVQVAGILLLRAQTAERDLIPLKDGKHYPADHCDPVRRVLLLRSPFIINEIGNGSGSDTNDWVEIRNVTRFRSSR